MKILLVDDHVVVREGVKRLIASALDAGDSGNAFGTRGAAPLPARKTRTS